MITRKEKMDISPYEIKEDKILYVSSRLVMFGHEVTHSDEGINFEVKASIEFYFNDDKTYSDYEIFVEDKQGREFNIEQFLNDKARKDITMLLAGC